MKICRVCGSSTEGNDKFCHNCGVSFTAEENAQKKHKEKKKNNRIKLKITSKQAIFLTVIVFLLLVIAIFVVAFKMIFKVCSPLNQIGNEVKDCEEIFEDFFNGYEEIQTNNDSYDNSGEVENIIQECQEASGDNVFME